VDLWAIARYDLGLAIEEFEDLTPLTFQALCKRRNLKFKMDRYANALTAAAIYNVNRASTDAPLIEPMDFVREPDPYRENTLEIKRLIKQVICQLPACTTTEKLQKIRTRTIASLSSQGRTDAEQLFDECWPSLKRA
jgi:hypothetical protein